MTSGFPAGPPDRPHTLSRHSFAGQSFTWQSPARQEASP
jgi:hypothetical protein